MTLRCAIIGGGVIGTGWAVAFARAGAEVRIFDLRTGQADAARRDAIEILGELHAIGLSASPDACTARLHVSNDLGDALEGADYIQESIAEDANAKASFFASLPALGANAIVASSTSAIHPDVFFKSARDPSRCIVAHPFNPPYLIPVVEVLKSSWTSASTCSKTCEMLTSLGMSPVILDKIVPGFVVNRLQAAVINEAMSLVAEGVAEPDQIDRCMRDGLGLRWAFLGPFETMDLNAPGGIGEYIEKFATAYQALGLTLDAGQPWRSDAIERVIAARRAAISSQDLPLARRHRDASVAALLQLRQLR